MLVSMPDKCSKLLEWILDTFICNLDIAREIVLGQMIETDESLLCFHAVKYHENLTTTATYQCWCIL